MRFLVITNLYPPQELGGYGRCLADFVWGLQQLGHYIKVLTSDAPYLNRDPAIHSSEVCSTPILRTLKLKGSYENGVSLLEDLHQCQQVDRHNILCIDDALLAGFDGILVGNIDMIGVEIIPCLLSSNIPVLHHIGFVSPPFSPNPILDSPNYHILPASNAVAFCLRKAGFDVPTTNTVYPGARTDLFHCNSSNISSGLSLALAQIKAGFEIGSPANPLKIGFAGLIMSSKGVHTIVEAIILLRQKGVCVQANIAGDIFQSEYFDRLNSFISSSDCSDVFHFMGCLDRSRLIRFWDLQHIGIFPSIFPEAFGISAAEILSSGLLLISSGVGGASELFTSGVNGFSFKADDPTSLSQTILNVIKNPEQLFSLSAQGKMHVQQNFSVSSSALKLEKLFKTFSSAF